MHMKGRQYKCSCLSDQFFRSEGLGLKRYALRMDVQLQVGGMCTSCCTAPHTPRFVYVGDYSMLI